MKKLSLTLICLFSASTFNQSFGVDEDFSGFSAALVLGRHSGMPQATYISYNDDPRGIPYRSKIPTSGFTGGLQLGYTAVWGGTALGLDLGALKDWSEGGSRFGSAVLRRRSSFFVAPRIGLVWGSTMLYVRFGVATAAHKLKWWRDRSRHNETAGLSFRNTGALVGAGIQAKKGNASVFLNYDISYYGNKNFDFPSCNHRNGTFKLKQSHTALLGLVWHFNS
jgi:hypothetical protein